MGYNLGLLLRGENMKKPKAEKRRGEEDSREHIRRTLLTIKRVIKEPDELPKHENVPAIKELFENGIETP